MAIKRFPIRNRNGISEHLNELKTMFMTNNPNLFSKVIVEDNVLKFYGRTRKIDGTYENDEQLLFELSITEKDNNRNYISFTLYTSAGNSSYTNIQPLDESTILAADESAILQSNYYLNYISEYIKIKDNACALSLTNVGTIDRTKVSPGIIIFARTYLGKIGVIIPSYTFFNVSPPSVAGNTNYKNYLICADIDTIGAPYYENMECNKISGFRSIFHPLAIAGEPEDYIPGAYFVPITSAHVESYIDGTINSGEKEYYYNGMVCVET